ncbi:hypothetical protein PSI15_18340 [Xenorhabdus sp. PR6a]|uniref:hypothetical protein n=1 Tax=Xenorhabdus sp. PR6a TaxID=3025877 RepID=UPI002358922C|nr:hypothetical protein [Xenorhabdus sp. PR6a]MDC9581595.1 hypothetical protein [Xenorhabdus sp. PR6a]MDC9583461.1 hypothetical protein [Xenorhabdus sp. PR6a]
MSMDTRATMSSAPDEPKNGLGFNKPLFSSGYSSGRLAVHVINNQSSQNQMDNVYFTV